MPYASPLRDEIEFTDRFGDKRVVHKKVGGGLAVKRTNVTPVLALNQALSSLVGARVRTLRIDRGYTLAELCERAGIVSATPKSRMWEIENSARRQGLRLGTLYALAMALDVEVADLMPSVAEIAGIAKPQKATRSAVALVKSA